jgi:hypothetical protein
MLIIKGCLLVFGLVVVLLILIVVLGRGMMFPAQLLPRLGMFLVGAGLGVTAVGCGMFFLGRVALAHLNRGLQQQQHPADSFPNQPK